MDKNANLTNIRYKQCKLKDYNSFFTLNTHFLRSAPEGSFAGLNERYCI